MRRFAASEYDIQTGRDRVTGEYVAIVSEFPSLSWVSRSRVHAADGLRGALAEVLEDMYSEDEPVPAPRARELNSIFLAGNLAPA